MSSVSKNVKTSNAELDRWRASAERAGLPLNGWIRQGLNRVADLEDALEREERRHQDASKREVPPELLL